MQNPAKVTNSEIIQLLVRTAIETYAQGFQTRHELEHEDPNGTLNMKIHNVFIAALGPEIQYYNALVRSLDSSLGNMLEKLAMNIAMLNFEVYFATAYNRFGEGKPWQQERVRQFFAKEELLIGRDFWNFICQSADGYTIVLQAYKDHAHFIVEALESIKGLYLGGERRTMLTGNQAQISNQMAFDVELDV